MIASGVSLIRSDDEKEKATEEALHWLIALQEDPDDPGVLERLDTWVSSKPQNQQAWAEAQRVWNAIGETQSVSASSPFAKTPFVRQSQERRGSSWRPRPLRVAASVAGVASICLAVLFIRPAIDIWLHADYSTHIAETREIRLEDGSIAYLGADRAIDVAFEPGLRRLRLLSGEAYFEVEPDPQRPFQVAAGPLDATVLGTAFDVRMMSDGVSVAVNHGRVAVAAHDVRQELDAPLEAGDWVRVDRDGDVERGNDAPDLAGGWRSGMLVVKDRPVAEVIDEIRRHYRGSIVLADGALGKKRVTGVYNLGKPLDALYAVAQAHGARVRQISPWIVLVSSR